MIQLILDNGISHLNLPPSLLQLLPMAEIPTVKVVIVGGEACSAELVDRWAPGRKFFNAYGPTEATIGSTVHECVANGQPPPIGRPIANKQIYILDSHLELVPVGVSGELHIGGIGLARGYWGQPDLTAERFVPNPFSDEPGARMYRTGDLAQFLADGSIRFLGRMDQQVKIRGFRIELEEIETVLAQHPGVLEAVLVAHQATSGGQRLVAYLVPNQGAAPTPTDLRGFLKKRLPSYMIPSSFVVLRSLPLTPNGKIDRDRLPEPEWSRDELTQEYVAPRTALEEALTGIWSSTLGIDRAGIHDSFFNLGGHSLLATQIVSRVYEILHVQVPLRIVFDTPTIAGMAAYISEQQGNVAPAQELEQMMVELEQMPDEEVKRALLNESSEYLAQGQIRDRSEWSEM